MSNRENDPRNMSEAEIQLRFLDVIETRFTDGEKAKFLYIAEGADPESIDIDSAFDDIYSQNHLHETLQVPVDDMASTLFAQNGLSESLNKERRRLVLQRQRDRLTIMARFASVAIANTPLYRILNPGSRS